MFLCIDCKHPVLAFHLSPKLPLWVHGRLGSTVRMATHEYRCGFARAWELTLEPKRALSSSRSFGLELEPWKTQEVNMPL